MPQTVLNDKKGMTLIEVVIALLVLLIVFLALMQTALVGIDANMLNVLRDEAVGIAEQSMTDVRNMSFDCLASEKLIDPSTGSCTIFSPSTVPVQRNLRNKSNFPYQVLRTVTNLSTDTVQVVITIAWDWKENPYTHTISTIVRRQ